MKVSAVKLLLSARDRVSFHVYNSALLWVITDMLMVLSSLSEVGFVMKSLRTTVMTVINVKSNHQRLTLDF